MEDRYPHNCSGSSDPQEPAASLTRRSSSRGNWNSLTAGDIVYPQRGCPSKCSPRGTPHSSRKNRPPYLNLDKSRIETWGRMCDCFWSRSRDSLPAAGFVCYSAHTQTHSSGRRQSWQPHQPARWYFCRGHRGIFDCEITIGCSLCFTHHPYYCIVGWINFFDWVASGGKC